MCIAIQAGTPVKWIIDAPKSGINGCNYRMFLPEYGITHTFQEGENVIEFTPSDTRIFPYTCWMGMIRGIRATDGSTAPQEENSVSPIIIEGGASCRS